MIDGEWPKAKILPERDNDKWFSVVVDLGSDKRLHVTSHYPDQNGADGEAEEWCRKNSYDYNYESFDTSTRTP